MSETSKPCEWALDHIEPYLDGEMNAGERAGLEAHCVTCAACARELSVAIRIRREIRSLPVIPVPAHVIVNSEREIAAAASNVVPLRMPRARRRLVLPAMAAAVATVVAVLWFGFNEHWRGTGYSEADIRRAGAEMALAFHYVDKYSDGIVRSEVEKRVVPRIERALREDESKVTSPPPGRSSL